MLYCQSTQSYVRNYGYKFSATVGLLGVIYTFSLFVIFARGTLTLGTYDV
jgi:hypothetical protein